MAMVFQSPPRCGLCGHTVRDDEPYEQRTWETHSGAPVPGVVHLQPCPEVVPVHCPPCLQALLAGESDEPHTCKLTTTLAVDGARFVILAHDQDCLCRCQRPAESPALKAARAQARRSGAGGAP